MAAIAITPDLQGCISNLGTTKSINVGANHFAE